MKITKRQLKRIIREEKQKLLKESVEENPKLMDYWNLILQEFANQFPGVDTSYYGDKILAAMEEEYAAIREDYEVHQSDFSLPAKNRFKR